MSESKYNLSFKIKQHTPIIHFQHDQTGATLRASELKPKLDKFLFDKCKNKKCPALPFGEKGNLDYKVKILSEKSTNEKPNKYLYFAKEHNMLKFQKIKINIFSFNLNILECIKKFFNEFLLTTNFGTRASKGYGSFSLDPPGEIEKILVNKYKNIFILTQQIDISNWEKKIDSFHKQIKAGILFKKKDSLLLEYMFQKKGIIWEKEFIKNKFPELRKGKAPIDCNKINSEFRYIRSMLGLANINEYNKGDDKVIIKHNPKGKDDKEKKQNEIERFQTPILYKVINQTVYILPDDSYKKIMGESFNFSYNENNYDIYTPKTYEFDLIDFLEFVETKKLIKRLKYEK